MTGLFADFIIPSDDPVYPFLQMTHTLKMTNANHFQYPLYYNDIMTELLVVINNNRNPMIYRNQAYFHYNRLNMDYTEEFDIAIYPFKRVPTSIGNLFRKDPRHHRLVTMTDPRTSKTTLLPAIAQTRNETYIYISGILGFDYDFKTYGDDTVNRMRRYYGVEVAGNFTENFGFFVMFNKGHYIGDDAFIEEQPFLSKMEGFPNGFYKDGDRYYRVDMRTEIDFKNPFLNLSMGYGGFDIGRTISSSIILNSDVTPYGYLKINKRFKNFEYNGITAQLIPDDMENVPFSPKGMALQTISLNMDSFSVGVGNSIIYGDRSFDLAYSTPLAIYKIIDNKYHGRDNGLFYVFNEIRLFRGMNFYSNILFDDIRKDRFGTKEWMSYMSYQGGLIFQMPKFPMEIAGEVTAVGPSTYGHKSENSLTYMQDNMMLGHRHGSNFLSFATRMRFHFPRVAFGFYYENMQQGDRANWVDNYDGEAVFLSDNITRTEFFKVNLDVRLIPELYLFARYEYQNHNRGRELHYIFTGAEFKY
jgi:hypothetical protein